MGDETKPYAWGTYGAPHIQNAPETSSAELTIHEIVTARAEDKLRVDANGLGFVPTEWLENLREGRAMWSEPATPPEPAAPALPSIPRSATYDCGEPGCCRPWDAEPEAGDVDNDAPEPAAPDCTCATARFEDDPCPAHGTPEPAAPRDPACTCGSGGHPRECGVHPEAYAAHVAELQAEYDVQDAADDVDRLVTARTNALATRPLRAPEPDEAERDSPPFTPRELTELAARGYERAHRHEHAVPARVSPEEWAHLREMQEAAREVGEHLAEVRQRFGLDAPEPDEAERVAHGIDCQCGACAPQTEAQRAIDAAREWLDWNWPVDDFEHKVIPLAQVLATYASAAEARGREDAFEATVLFLTAGKRNYEAAQVAATDWRDEALRDVRRIRALRGTR